MQQPGTGGGHIEAMFTCVPFAHSLWTSPEWLFQGVTAGHGPDQVLYVAANGVVIMSWSVATFCVALHTYLHVRV